MGRRVGVLEQQKLTQASAWTQMAPGSVRFGWARRRGSLLDAPVDSGLLGRVVAGPEGQRDGEDVRGQDLGPEGVQVARAEGLDQRWRNLRHGWRQGAVLGPQRCRCETGCLRGRGGGGACLAECLLPPKGLL